MSRVEQQSKRFEALDAFRGLSAISVVVYHMHLVGSVTESSFFRGSAIFVEFFFVLSGFVLVHGYAFKKDLKFIPYIMGRFFRLYPLHLVMFFVIFLFEIGKWLAYKYGGIMFNGMPFTDAMDPKEIVPNLLLLQSWLPWTNFLSYNFPSWSISIEFYLYIILFLTILVFKKIRIVIWSLISIIFLSLLAMSLGGEESVVLRGFSCFFGGAVMYSIYKRIPNLKIPYVLGSVVEGLLLMLVFYVVQLNMGNRTPAIVVFYIFVLFFSYESGFFSFFLKKSIFQLLGKLSYSIYMIHSAFLLFLISLSIVFQKVTYIEISPTINGVRYLTFGNGFVNTIFVIFIVSSIIYVSNLTYQYVELKGQVFGKKIMNKEVR